MANRSVDLLQPEEISPVEKRRALALKTGTIFLVVFYCLFIVAVFAFWLVTQQEAKIVTERLETKQAKLTELREVEVLQLLLKQRLSSLFKVVEVGKPSLKSQLNYLESLVPEGVTQENIQWNSDESVKTSGIAGNALVLSDYLERLKEAADKKKVAKSTLLSATRQEEGVYSFSLEILLEEQEE